MNRLLTAVVAAAALSLSAAAAAQPAHHARHHELASHYTNKGNLCGGNGHGHTCAVPTTWSQGLGAFIPVYRKAVTGWPAVQFPQEGYCSNNVPTKTCPFTDHKLDQAVYRKGCTLVQITWSKDNSLFGTTTYAVGDPVSAGLAYGLQNAYEGTGPGGDGHDRWTEFVACWKGDKYIGVRGDNTVFINVGQTNHSPHHKTMYIACLSTPGTAQWTLAPWRISKYSVDACALKSGTVG